MFHSWRGISTVYLQNISYIAQGPSCSAWFNWSFLSFIMQSMYKPEILSAILMLSQEYARKARWMPCLLIHLLSTSLGSGFNIDSLAPGRFEYFSHIIFKLNLVNGGWGVSYEIAIRWMPLDLTDDKSTLVQVMAWCRKATSHYLSQCWHRSVSNFKYKTPYTSHM